MLHSISSLGLMALAVLLALLPFHMAKAAPHLHVHLHHRLTSVATAVSTSAGPVDVLNPDKSNGNMTCSGTGRPDLQARDVTFNQAMSEANNEYVAVSKPDHLPAVSSTSLVEPPVSATLAVTTVVEETGPNHIMQPHLRLYQTASTVATSALPSLAYSGTETTQSAGTPTSDPKPVISRTSTWVSNTRTIRLKNGKVYRVGSGFKGWQPGLTYTVRLHRFRPKITVKTTVRTMTRTLTTTRTSFTDAPQITSSSFTSSFQIFGPDLSSSRSKSEIYTTSSASSSVTSATEVNSGISSESTWVSSSLRSVSSDISPSSMSPASTSGAEVSSTTITVLLSSMSSSSSSSSSLVTSSLSGELLSPTSGLFSNEASSSSAELESSYPTSLISGSLSDSAISLVTSSVSSPQSDPVVSSFSSSVSSSQSHSAANWLSSPLSGSTFESGSSSLSGSVSTSTPDSTSSSVLVSVSDSMISSVSSLTLSSTSELASSFQSESVTGSFSKPASSLSSSFVSVAAASSMLSSFTSPSLTLESMSSSSLPSGSAGSGPTMTIIPPPPIKFASGSSVIEPKVHSYRLQGPSNYDPTSQYIKWTNPPNKKLPDSLLTVGPNNELTTGYGLAADTGVLSLDDTTMSMLAPLKAKPHLSRDGGKGGYLNGQKLFLFCDTGSYTPATAEKAGDFLGFVSSSAAVDKGMKGAFGDALVLEDGVGQWADDVGRMRGFFPLTDGEQSYNLVMQGKGQRYAVWPESSIIPLNLTHALVYAPIIYHTVEWSTRKIVFTYTGTTLLSITAGPGIEPRAERLVDKLFTQDEVEWGTIAGLRSYGPSGVGGNDGRVYLVGKVDSGLLAARVDASNVTQRDSYEFWDGTSWSKTMVDRTSTSFFLPGAYMDGDLFYSPAHQTFIWVYLTPYVDNTFYYRYLKADHAIRPAGVPGGDTGDFVENIVKYAWSEEQILYRAKPGPTGMYIYAGGVQLGYFDADDITNGGKKLLLSWTAPTGGDPAALNSEYLHITAQVEFV